MSKIVERIKRLAQEQRLSIRQIEIAAEVSNGAIARWDEKMPSVDKVYRVANVLGCTVDDLIRDDPAEATGGADEPETQYFRSVAQ